MGFSIKDLLLLLVQIKTALHYTFIDAITETVYVLSGVL